MSDWRVLVVDDEADFRRLIGDTLAHEGMTVLIAEDGLKARRMVAASPPDAVLLDWNLPGVDGLALCKAWKADPSTKNIPVILLTARHEETDAVLGLEMGADDYIIKRALRPRELIARLRAVVRRRSDEESAVRVISDGRISVDLDRREAVVRGKSVSLRPKEFDLLGLFLKNVGRVLSRARLAETVWGADYLDTSRAIDSAVARLRGELGPEGKRLVAYKGLGYKLESS
jgi:DNA-binding response OmpR family regulator